MLTAYSCPPILAVPVGRIRFCALIAALTSWAATPYASSFCGSRSTEICRLLPPYGRGNVVPCTTASCCRIRYTP
jgi:hypothetical protein